MVTGAAREPVQLVGWEVEVGRQADEDRTSEWQGYGEPVSNLNEWHKLDR